MRILRFELGKALVYALDKDSAILAITPLPQAAVARWLTVDPERQFASPYLGMGNNPLIGIDPAGAWVYFYSLLEAERAVSNLNSIFQTKFGIANAVSITHKVVTKKYYATYWDELWGITSSRQESRQYIIWNSQVSLAGLDPELRFVAESFKNVLEAPTHILGQIAPANQMGLSYPIGYTFGHTYGPKHFAVPNNLPDFDPSRINFNIGSQIMHEILWHISPAGKTLFNAGYDSNWLYKLIGGRSGHAHIPGMKQNIKVKTPRFSHEN